MMPLHPIPTMQAVYSRRMPSNYSFAVSYMDCDDRCRSNRRRIRPRNCRSLWMAGDSRDRRTCARRVALGAWRVVLPTFVVRAMAVVVAVVVDIDVVVDDVVDTITIGRMEIVPKAIVGMSALMTMAMAMTTRRRHRHYRRFYFRCRCASDDVDRRRRRRCC